MGPTRVFFGGDLRPCGLTSHVDRNLHRDFKPRLLFKGSSGAPRKRFEVPSAVDIRQV